MKTMSDFIMEQETEAITSDVSVLEGFMKVQAIGAVAECYCEHAAIAAFCESADMDSIFTESDESLGKRMWGSIKAFFENLIEWFKAIVKGIISFFTTRKIDRVIEELKKAQRENRVQKLDLAEVNMNYIDPEAIFALISAFKNVIDSISETENSGAVKTHIEKLQKNLDEYIKDGKTELKKTRFDSDKATVSTDIGVVISKLEELQSRGPAKNGKNLLKELGYKPKEAKTGDDKAVDKETNKAIKKLANSLAKSYDKYVKMTVKLVDKALGEAESKAALEELQQSNKNRESIRAARKSEAASDAAAESKETKAEESYVSNTDGYYFL